MTNISLDAIFAHLKKKNHNPQLQEATQQVYMMLMAGGKELPLFFRICDDGHLLQMLAFIPSPLKPDILGDMARLLHLLNKELDVPGFGMDEKAGVVFYRLMLPTPNKKLDSHVLDAFINTFQKVCETFTPPIQAVGYGAATLDEILAKAAENNG